MHADKHGNTVNIIFRVNSHCNTAKGIQVLVRFELWRRLIDYALPSRGLQAMFSEVTAANVHKLSFSNIGD